MNRSARRGSCSICLAPHEARDSIEAQLARGVAARAVSRALSEDAAGITFDYRTISAHWRRCLGHSFKLHGRAAQRRGEIIRAAAHPGADLATVIRDAAARALEAGELSISTTHGLRAQNMLDLRADRSADRDLMVRMALILSGAAPPPGIIRVSPNDLLESSEG